MLHEDITDRIIRAAMKVHSRLGPGLLERTYTACLLQELISSGLRFQHQIQRSTSQAGPEARRERVCPTR
jgi:GxxExxY protein